MVHSDFVAPAPAGSPRVALVVGSGRETWQNKLLQVTTPGGRAIVLSPPNQAISAPSWSPDGRRLAYVAMPAAPELAGGDEAYQAIMDRRIWITADTPSEAPIQLTDDDNYQDGIPFWSVDGRHLLFARLDQDGQASLWLIATNPEEAELIQVVDELTPAPDPFGFYGHLAWDGLFNWWQPSTATLAPATVNTRSLATFLPHLAMNLTAVQAVERWGEPDEIVEGVQGAYKYQLVDGLMLWLQFDGDGPILAAGLEGPDGTLTELALQPSESLATAVPMIQATPTPALIQLATATPIPLESNNATAETTAAPVEVLEITATPLATAVPPTAVPPESMPATTPPVVFCGQCGEHNLLLHNGEVTQLDLPQIRDGVFYDYTAATGRILYGSQFPDHGGGPGNLSVSDLYLWELDSNEATALIPEEVVVRALWAPDGNHFVYLGATAETYELRWRSLAGEDRLLATDAALTFSVSPSGREIAFTRESNYNLDITPGIFIVDIVSGEERQVSTIDKAGTGSIDDRPMWSPDETYLLMNLQREEGMRGLYRILTDGTSTVEVGFHPALADELWYEAQPFHILWLDRTHFLGTPFVYTANAALGGEPLVVRYQLNEELDTIVAGTLIAEGSLVGWNLSGQSVWVQDSEGVQIVPLP
jgi:dipeptidyl aminopeptidase/acylaminoacyl peptidase